jgi:hypothetical protein
MLNPIGKKKKNLLIYVTSNDASRISEIILLEFRVGHVVLTVPLYFGSYSHLGLFWNGASKYTTITLLPPFVIKCIGLHHSSVSFNAL